MDMNTLTLIMLAWELHQEEISNTRIAKQLGKNRETIIRWIQGITSLGLLGFLEAFQQAKKGPRMRRQVDALLKQWVWSIREREFDCCGQKIAYYLTKEHQVSLSVSKIYEILKEKYVIKSKWKKNQVRGPIPHASTPREVVQMDTIDFGDIFAFTGIDIYTKDADILLAPALTAQYGCQFLDQSMDRRFDGHVNLLQNDGGPEFKAEFKQQVHQYCDRHRIARPYRKNEQAYIESFNRTVRKECLGWTKYRQDQLATCTHLVDQFLARYHTTRPHMGLGMKTILEAKETDCRISTEN